MTREHTLPPLTKNAPATIARPKTHSKSKNKHALTDPYNDSKRQSPNGSKATHRNGSETKSAGLPIRSGGSFHAIVSALRASRFYDAQDHKQNALFTLRA